MGIRFGKSLVANKDTQRLALATKETNEGAGARGEGTGGGEGGDEKRVTLQNGEAGRLDLLNSRIEHVGHFINCMAGIVRTISSSEVGE